VTTEHNILAAARELIRDPDHWTVDVFARDADGKAVDPWDDNACHWCALGAVAKARGWWIVPSDNAEGTLYRVAMDKFSMGVPSVNDKLGHTSVMAIFSAALGEESDAADDSAAA
jgi:hypothetical protein